MDNLAIAYDFLSHRGGGEQLLLDILDLYPAPVYTVYHEPDKTFSKFNKCEVCVSSLQAHLFKHLPSLRNALLPLGIESLDFRNYDVVLSVGTWMRGVITQPHTLHIDYCLSPNRRLWDTYQAHRNNMNKAWFGTYNSFFSRVSNWMRVWDYAAAQRPDAIFTISNTVRQRIWKYYKRDATVIYPPVDTRGFYHKKSEGYYLTVSRLYPEKRIDIIIKAFRKNGYPLKIVGEGPDKHRLEKLAIGYDNIEFTGYVTSHELKELYASCEAFIFTALDEDFGIAPVEANAAGKPVIAINEGGLRETIIDAVSGVLFNHAEPDALNDAIKSASELAWDEKRIRANALRFDTEVFKRDFTNATNAALNKWNENNGII